MLTHASQLGWECETFVFQRNKLIIGFNANPFFHIVVWLNSFQVFVSGSLRSIEREQTEKIDWEAAASRVWADNQEFQREKLQNFTRHSYNNFLAPINVLWNWNCWARHPWSSSVVGNILFFMHWLQLLFWFRPVQQIYIPCFPWAHPPQWPKAIKMIWPISQSHCPPNQPLCPTTTWQKATFCPLSSSASAENIFRGSFSCQNFEKHYLNDSAHSKG